MQVGIAGIVSFTNPVAIIEDTDSAMLAARCKGDDDDVCHRTHHLVFVSSCGGGYHHGVAPRGSERKWIVMPCGAYARTHKGFLVYHVLSFF
jgi:hypothetical protein